MATGAGKGSGHPKVDAALSYKHPLFRKRYLLFLVSVTFLFAFRSVLLNPLKYGTGIVLAPLSLLANAFPILLFLFFTPLSPFFYIVTIPSLLLFTTGLVIKLAYSLSLEVSVWLGRAPTFVGFVIQPLSAVCNAVDFIPVARTLLGLRRFPDYLVMEAGRAEEMYGGDALGGRQVVRRVAALTLKACGTVAAKSIAPLRLAGSIPKSILVWGRAARVKAQRLLSLARSDESDPVADVPWYISESQTASSAEDSSD